MALTKEAKKALLADITAQEELPIEKIPAVIDGKKSDEVSPLYRVCSPIKITSEELKKAGEIITKMASVLERYREIIGTGRALAANQIGIEKQVVVFLHPDGTFYHYLNPEITERSEEKNIYWEMCMSGAPLGVDVIRPTTVKIHWFDVEGKEYEKELSGFDARRMQHEIDHLHGKVCYNTDGTSLNTLGYSYNPQDYLKQKLRPVKT